MTFWIIIVALSLVVVLMLARPVVRGAEIALPDAAEYDLKVYTDQLAEVERDIARGVISGEDGQRARAEISRRILSADAARDTQTSAGPSGARSVIALFGLALIGGSVSLYTWIGQPGYGDLAPFLAGAAGPNRPVSRSR